MLSADGRDWATTDEAADWWPDVTPDMVRQWAHRGRLNGVRVGRRVYYDVNELTEAEHAARTSPRGNKRSVVPAGQHPLTS